MLPAEGQGWDMGGRSAGAKLQAKATTSPAPDAQPDDRGRQNRTGRSASAETIHVARAQRTHAQGRRVRGRVAAGSSFAVEIASRGARTSDRHGVRLACLW